MSRETAYRIFSRELNMSIKTVKGDEEMSPTYVVSPLGAKINRVMISGNLSEVTNAGTEEEPMWKGKVQDVSGTFFINVGRFQQEASAAMANLDASCYVSIIGKVKTYNTNDGRTFVSLRPEHIVRVEEEDYVAWILEAAKSTWKRLLDMKKALEIPDVTEKDLTAKGFTQQEASGIITALDTYGSPDSATYLRMIQDAIRRLLPDEEIDFGLSGDASSIPESTKEEEDGNNDTWIEDKILEYLDELDSDPRGVYMDDLIRKGEADGISPEKIESISSSLMDKGLVYEPNLGYLKKI